jgi:hypothetical protein
VGLTVRQATVALGLKTPSVVYDLLAARRLTGRKVRQVGRICWDIDVESVEAEKERREKGAEPPNRYRPVHFVLPDTHEAMRTGDLKSLAPEDVADWVRWHRAAAYAAQQQRVDAPLQN